MSISTHESTDMEATCTAETAVKELNVLWNGVARASLLTCRETQTGHFRHEKFTDLIANGWEQKSDIARSNNYPFYNGPLARFEGFHVGESGLTFDLSLGVNYKDVVGLRAAKTTPCELGLLKRCDPNAFSIFNIVTTTDHKIPFGLRKSGDWEESFELSGGFLREDEMGALAESSLNRLREDLAMDAVDLCDHYAFSLYENPNIFETTLAFECQASFSSSEFVRPTKYDKVIFIDNSAAGLAELESLPIKIHAPSLQVLKLYLALRT